MERALGDHLNGTALMERGAHRAPCTLGLLCHAGASRGPASQAAHLNVLCNPLLWGATLAGFIQKLPTQLVAAFRATLEEIAEASLLLHVVDVSHPTAAAQVETVNEVLKELGVAGIPMLHVWNKVSPGSEDWGGVLLQFHMLG